jgi:hypothetical protein
VQSTAIVQNSPNLWRTCGISKIAHFGAGLRTLPCGNLSAFHSPIPPRQRPPPLAPVSSYRSSDGSPANIAGDARSDPGSVASVAALAVYFAEPELFSSEKPVAGPGAKHSRRTGIDSRKLQSSRWPHVQRCQTSGRDLSQALRTFHVEHILAPASHQLRRRACSTWNMCSIQLQQPPSTVPDGLHLHTTALTDLSMTDAPRGDGCVCPATAPVLPRLRLWSSLPPWYLLLHLSWLSSLRLSINNIGSKALSRPPPADGSCSSCDGFAAIAQDCPSHLRPNSHTYNAG